MKITISLYHKQMTYIFNTTSMLANIFKKVIFQSLKGDKKSCLYQRRINYIESKSFTNSFVRRNLYSSLKSVCPPGELRPQFKSHFCDSKMSPFKINHYQEFTTQCKCGMMSLAHVYKLKNKPLINMYRVRHKEWDALFLSLLLS